MSTMMIAIIVAVIVVIAVAVIVLKGKAKNPPPALSKPPAAKPVAKPAAAPVAAPKPVTPPRQAAVAPTDISDPIDDAKAFIALDRLPQAVGILSKAIDKDPKRAALYVLLLDIYQRQNDREQFDQLQQRLNNINDSSANQQAEQLLAKFPAPVIKPSADDALHFTPTVIPSAEVAAQPVPILDDGHSNSLDFHTDQPISEGSSPTLELDQSDERAFHLDTPEPSLEELDQAFNFTSPITAPTPAATPTAAPAIDNSAREQDIQPLSDLDFNFSDKADRAPVDAPSTTAEKAPTDQVVDLEFNLDESFELADDKADNSSSGTQEWAKGLDDLDFSLPPEDQVQALPDSTTAPTLGLDLAADQPSIDDKASQFDAQLLSPEVATADSLDSPSSLDSPNNIASVSVIDAAPVLAEPAVLAVPLFNDVAPSSTPSASNAATDSNFADFQHPLANEFAFLKDQDAQQINLELAQHYVELGEISSAQALLDEVIAQGTAEQQQQAQHTKASLNQ